MNIYFWLLVLIGVIEEIVRFEDMVFAKVWEKKREEEEGKKKLLQTLSWELVKLGLFFPIFN